MRLLLCLFLIAPLAQAQPAPLRLESVVLAPVQPHAADPAVIWYDDFVVSTKPIGPLTASPNPTLIRMADPECAGWEVQLAADPAGASPVWFSGTLPAADLRVKADSQTGQFTGTALGRATLAAGQVYFCRARQRDGAGQWSSWSTWHQPFTVQAEPSATRLSWLQTR